MIEVICLEQQKTLQDYGFEFSIVKKLSLDSIELYNYPYDADFDLID
jgi:hypothetical protein